jgi:hypothetical protein
MEQLTIHFNLLSHGNFNISSVSISGEKYAEISILDNIYKIYIINRLKGEKQSICLLIPIK